ncbi:hypothetical protein SLA2020_206830 [Shorea laevis]
MISQHNFFDNYLLLKPKEANVFDLVHILFSSSLLERKRFIECPAELPKYTDFRRRWLIFISVLAQKLFLLLNTRYTPMAKTGYALEMCLYLLSSNRGFLKLLRNLFKGEVVWPDRSSATFVSLVGNLDRRIDLGRNIRPGNRKYKASLSVMAAKLSYENEAFIKTTVEKQWQVKLIVKIDEIVL